MTLNAVALVTGAGRGIGRAIALRLAKDGYNLALNDIRRSEGLDDVREEIKKMGRETVECIADVSNEGQVKTMVDNATKNLGGLDVMIANAGICIAKPFLETTLDDWDRGFNINGKGVFLCYKYAAQQMIKQGRGGRIIGACSQAGKHGFDSLTVYSATKFTVRSLTQSAAIALQPHGITVNAYAPGIIETSMLTTLRKDLAHLEQLDALKGEVGTPEEIAALVSYLVSKEARYVTGSISTVVAISIDREEPK
ncbi:hypothetical protein AGABI2DRAFT_194639 [Agaricus bisporus var. bisporus H97]|uniref:hypothetical protein n=1 Tax=Agaricus bisporus var. bisporus (strain H97 / ATCC MYA-4626 / FGSC 10389) TaxID=936046 RepID=UPI00029F55EF|nr:hypothetical protein AGABI2DRAFT_194639 [Agaricus bisporus var. bisporus H97]EKV44716.1 hypothetical protein AGABI2DRAFT_194639 [Agaricus bisporus var. bisporus H97]